MPTQSLASRSPNKLFATTNRPAAAISGYIDLFWRIDKSVLAPEIKKRRKRRKSVPQRKNKNKQTNKTNKKQGQKKRKKKACTLWMVFALHQERERRETKGCAVN